MIPRATQESVHQWAESVFPGADPGSPRVALRVLEEAVEFALAAGAKPIDAAEVVLHATSKVTGGDPKSPAWFESRPDPARLPAEAADVLVTLYRAAGVYGFDLHAECDKKQQRNESRRWRAFGDGCGQHIPAQGDGNATG